MPGGVAVSTPRVAVHDELIAVLSVTFVTGHRGRGIGPSTGTFRSMPTTSDRAIRERTIDVGATLGWYCHGPADPTTWMNVIGRGIASSGRFVRATLTPDGPGTLQITWQPKTGDDVHIESYGPGGDWLQARAPHMLGHHDSHDHRLHLDPHPKVAAAARHDSLRIGASGDLYHELLPTVIEQRITIGEAHRQWSRLCLELGDPAPGPFRRLVLPPDPAVLARQPSWWFHPLGIERKRAEPLINIARHADKFWTWAQLPPAEAGAMLRLIPGIGQWTVGTVLATALGDPDAVAVGDFHLKNIVANTLAGEPRATDERMLELLDPYVGQRGRVVRLLLRNGGSTPKYGPKKRILPMHAW